MTINIFMYIYIGENAHWDNLQIITQKNVSIFYFLFFFILDVYCYKYVAKNVFL